MPHAMDSNSDLAHKLAQIQQNQRHNLVDQLAHDALTPLIITKFINQIKLSKQLNVIKGMKILINLYHRFTKVEDFFFVLRKCLSDGTIQKTSIAGTDVNGGWSAWAEWSTALNDNTCSRVRYCSSPSPKCNGLTCIPGIGEISKINVTDTTTSSVKQITIETERKSNCIISTTTASSKVVTTTSLPYCIYNNVKYQVNINMTITVIYRNFKITNFK